MSRLFPGCVFVAAFVLCEQLPALADEFSAKVIWVIDGDTVIAVRGCQDEESASRYLSCADPQKLKIRLADIDAPEKSQEGGTESRRSLAELALHKEVRVSSKAVDGYGRMVAALGVAGMNVNEEQLRRGMAWEYSLHHGNHAYAALQREAQQARRGLWAQSDPVPPWHWRKLHADDVPTSLENPRPLPRPGCGSKRYCAQMGSCAEAYFYLADCGVTSLDQNRDGVPCENLCGAKHQDPAPAPQ